MIVQQIKNALDEAARKAYPELITEELAFDLVHPEIELHGDYASNIALILARRVKENPLKVAQLIGEQLAPPDEVEKYEVVQPGYINFFLSATFFETEMKAIIEKGSGYGKSDELNGKTILLEYGQPNTHKIPHIGHLFSYCYGESCARLLEITGAEVKRLNYQGDVGLHVAKCIWADLHWETLGKSTIKPQPNDSLLNKVNYLQSCYQEGSKKYEENIEFKDEIDKLNIKIYQRDPEIISRWKETRQWSVDYYKEFEAKISIHYNRSYFESETSEVGKQSVEDHIGNVFESSEGAVIFRGEPYGLHTRVFINRLGNPTYEAKDVGLMAKKREDWLPFDESIVLTANEQNDYWSVLLQVFELLFPDLKGKVRHIGFGMINLTTGKMSSRTGEFVSAFSLVKRVNQLIQDKMQNDRNYSPEEVAHISEVLTLSAIKYAFLKSNPKKDIAFDIETSVLPEGNSGPYLQYTYARTQSVLKKAGTVPFSSFQATNPEEEAIIRWIYRFPEVVQNATDTLSPHIVATFLYELAQRFSRFYNEHQILNDPAHIQSRLTLTAAVGEVLNNGLSLLGIETIDRV